MIAHKKCSKYSLLIKIANKRRFNLQLEDMVLITVRCFVVLQTGPDIKYHG